MTNFVIGVDCSTTGCKVIAWDAMGKPLAEGRADLVTQQPHPGWYEQDAEQWWDGLCRALGELGSGMDLTRAAAMAITHQRESFVPVNEEGEPLRNAILWLDERSRRQVAWLNETIGDATIHKLTGKPLSMIPSLPKIVWLRDEEPAVLAGAARIVDTHAFLIRRLAGEFRTSLASADPMGIVDMARGCWAGDLTGEIGLAPAQLPDLVPPGELIGKVSSDAARKTGLREGLPLFAGAGDGQSAGLGANATTPDTPYLNMGTAVVAGAFSSEYKTAKAYRTLCSPVAGCYYLETCLKGGVFTVGWFVEKFAPDLLDQPEPAEVLLEREAARVAPGCDGLLLVPYWHNVLNPYWDPAASGVVVGWTGNHGRAHFYRAVLEGIAFEQRLAGDGVMQSLGHRFERYLTMGGGSRSDLWCQILSDTTGVDIVRTATAEATCLGAGILAAVGADWYPGPLEAARAMTQTAEGFTPRAEESRSYGSLYEEVYRKLYPALAPLLSRLTELAEGEARTR
jgi:xylulokinase